MAKVSQGKVVEALLERHGKTYAQELGIRMGNAGPAALFRLLCASLLFSARISADIAVRAARALADRGWTDPGSMAAASWEERTRVLNRSGYARYDERTSRMLGETAAMLTDQYGGDLRRLRDDAGRDPRRERELLEQVKGIGDVGVDIFFREAQAAWEELYPFVDGRAYRSAERLGLPGDAKDLAQRVDGGAQDFARLVAALVRTELASDHEDVLASAGG